MDYNKLTSFVLVIVLVGMLVGVGVLTLDKFSNNVYDSKTVSNESFTVPAENGSVTFAKGENITALTYILNASGSTWNSSQYVFDASTGSLNNTGNSQECINGSTCYAYYSYYEYTTPATVSLDAGRDAVGDVSEVWLGLIVTIAVLAIILTLVIKGFGARRD